MKNKRNKNSNGLEKIYLECPFGVKDIINVNSMGKLFVEGRYFNKEQ